MYHIQLNDFDARTTVDTQDVFRFETIDIIIELIGKGVAWDMFHTIPVSVPHT